MSYYRRELIEQMCPIIMLEWDAWLEIQRDPGNYDAYKERDSSILPCINGKPQWVCDTYMPPHIEAKLPAALRG